VQRLPLQLRGDRLDDLRIAVADVENSEPAEAIYIRAPGDVAIGVAPGVGPFDDRAGAARIVRLAIFEKAGIDMIAEVFDRLVRDPLRFRRRDVGLFD